MWDRAQQVPRALTNTTCVLWGGGDLCDMRDTEQKEPQLCAQPVMGMLYYLHQEWFSSMSSFSPFQKNLEYVSKERNIEFVNQKNGIAANRKIVGLRLKGSQLE